jgi:hypothetical protein
MIAFDKGSPAEQHRAVDMLRQAGVGAYVSVEDAVQLQRKNQQSWRWPSL